MPYTNSYTHFTSLENSESPLFRHSYDVLDSTQIQDEHNCRPIMLHKTMRRATSDTFPEQNSSEIT